VLGAGGAVEGDAAVSALVEGLRAAAEARPDVILLVRGGGSYEDLMPFNAESVARAVVASPVPVVTGIGHEPDTSIADMVADLRTSTPTAAAEAVAPSAEEIAGRLSREQRLLARALSHRIQNATHRLTRIVSRPAFTDPASVCAPAGRALDVLRIRLQRAIPERLAHDAQRLDYAHDRLIGVAPRVTERARLMLVRQTTRLDDLSPLRILARGYAAAFAEDGHTVVRSVEQVPVGDTMVVRVSDGRFRCIVDSLEKEN